MTLPGCRSDGIKVFPEQMKVRGKASSVYPQFTFQHKTSFRLRTWLLSRSCFIWNPVSVASEYDVITGNTMFILNWCSSYAVVVLTWRPAFGPNGWQRKVLNGVQQSEHLQHDFGFTLQRSVLKPEEYEPASSQYLLLSLWDNIKYCYIPQGGRARARQWEGKWWSCRWMEEVGEVM